MTQSVLLIDDHALFREGLKALIGNDEDYAIAGEAGSGSEGLKMAGRIAPDLIILDLGLPDVSGVQIIQDLLEKSPESRIMVVTMHSKIGYIVESFQAGAMAYVVKESASDSLLKGMKAVSRGEYFLDDRVSHEVVDNLLNMPMQKMMPADEKFGSLTSREQEIMKYLSEGRSVREISEKLNISPKTVENHKANIMRKLGLQGTVDLVKYAVRIGLIDVDLWKS
jgi:DNA-binding NarL/FixJ family response regulator